MPVLSTIMLAASAVPVYVGRFDPKDFPNLITIERRLPHAEMTRRVETMFKNGECKMEGQTKRRFDIDVRYAVLMDTAGKPSQIVVEDQGCQPLAKLVGQVVAAQALRKDFKISHGEGARWYVSGMSFSLGEPVSAAQVANLDKKICKRSENVTGSRTKQVKVCKTAAEWQMTKDDRQQMHRDIRNASKDWNPMTE